MPSSRRARMGRNPKPNRCVIIVCLRKTVFIFVFLLVVSITFSRFPQGLSTGLIGPSILYLEKLSGSREDETALVFTSRAVGCIGGWVVSCLLLDSEGSTKPSDLLNVGLFGLVISNGLIVFVKHLWWMLAVFFLQGLFVTISLQGCVYHRENIRNRLHTIPQYLTAVFLLGCVFTPYLILFIEPNLNSITPLDGGGIHPSITLDEMRYPLIHDFVSSIPDIHSFEFVESSINNSSSNSRKISKFIRFPRHISDADPLPSNKSTLSPQRTLNVTVNINYHDQLHNLSLVLSNLTLPNEITMRNETFLNNVTNSSITTTIKPSVKKKPSVNDAKHLNQDSSSADGSQTASKMKKLTEERQIEKLVNDLSHKTSVIDPNKLQKSPFLNQSNTTVLMNIPNLDLTNTNNNITENLSDSLSSHFSFQLYNISTEFPHNSSTTVIDKDQISDETFTDNHVNLSNDTNTPNTSEPVTKVILGVYNITDEVELLVGNNSSTHLVFNKFSPVLRSTDNVVTEVVNSTNKEYHRLLPPFSHHSHHHRIAEHSVNRTHRILILPFQHPMESIQKVYLLLSVISMILWLLTIPLTSWCESIFTRFFGLQFMDDSGNNNNNFELVSISTSKHHSSPSMQQSDSVGNRENSDEGLKSRLLERLDKSDSESDSDELWVTRRYFDDKNIEAIVCYSDSESIDGDRVVTSKNLLNEPSLLTKSMTDHSLSKSTTPLNPDNGDTDSISNTTCMIDHSVFETHWPKIQWPSNFWLLLSVFLNSGLETTYGGFVASLTIRYLLWSPTLAIIVTSLFWLGNLFGFLIRLLIINTKWSDLRDILPGNPNTQSLLKRRRLRRSYMKNAKSSIIITIIQLCGCFVCATSAIALTHLSMSTGRCSLTTLSSSSTSSLSHPYLTWLIGSFCFGIGIGLSSSYIGTLMTMHFTTNLFFYNFYDIQLAYYFGQLLMPALIAMLHHQALFWRYSCVHSTSVLCLSTLMILTVIGHFITQTVKMKHGNSLFGSSKNNIGTKERSLCSRSRNPNRICKRSSSLQNFNR
ncbi:Major facilitator superfamily general substrate transporter [Schistosoma japonicum]|nr:Major facilitator superfamily general substrate transporter [Schistosoma japonicum]